MSALLPRLSDVMVFARVGDAGPSDLAAYMAAIMYVLVRMLQMVAVSVAYVVAGLLVLFVAKLLRDAFTPYKITRELTDQHNPALGLVIVGHLVSVVILYIAVATNLPAGPSSVPALAYQIGLNFLYVLGGIVALHLNQWIVDRWVLTGIRHTHEIIENRNVAVAAIEAGSRTATALILAGALHGQKAAFLPVFVFFVLAQVMLIVFARLYPRMAHYDVRGEVTAGNLASGVAMGVNLVAMGIVLFKTTVTQFDHWYDGFSHFIVATFLGFILIYALRRIADTWFLPGRSIRREIVERRHMNAAWIESVVVVSVAVMIFFLV